MNLISTKVSVDVVEKAKQEISESKASKFTIQEISDLLELSKSH